MLRLSEMTPPAAGPEPIWLDTLGGGKVLCKIATQGIMDSAQAWAARHIKMWKEDPAGYRYGRFFAGLDPKDEDDTSAAAEGLMRAGCALKAILDWEGIGDPKGKALDVTETNKVWFSASLGIGPDWYMKWLNSYLAVSAEGNASAPAPNGTSAAGSPTARTARPRKPRARKASRA